MPDLPLLPRRQPGDGAKMPYPCSGRIYDKESRERLIGASVYDSRLHVGAATNNYGFYTLIVPEGEVCLNYSYVGYQSASCQFYLKSDTVIHVELQPMLNLDEIVVVQPNIPEW